MQHTQPTEILRQVDTVLLDMDGTLLDLRFDNHFWIDHLPLRYSEIHNVPFSEAASHISQTLQAAEGSMNWYDVDHWADHFKVDIMALKREVTGLINFRPGTEKFLASLSTADHVDMHIVTDSHPQVLALKEEVINITAAVNGTWCSHHYGHPKREPEFWSALSEDLSFDPATTLMIDDSPQVLNQAREFGIRFPVCIDQPDSGRTREHNHDHAMINFLDELLP